MLIIEELNYKFILQNVSFQLPSTGFFALIGNNGSGKTTLLKCLLHLLKSSMKRYTFQQFNLLTASHLELKRQIAYVPALPTLHFSYTVQEMVLMGQFGLSFQLEEIHQIFELCDLVDLKKRSMETLSSGERQRVYLARALAMNTPILLLDEISAFLDWNQKIKYISLFKELRKKILIVAASHDFELVRQADAILHLNQGTLDFEADPEFFLKRSYPLLYD